MVSIHMSGEFPSPLYRGFNKKEYALSFIEQGSFIMRPIEYFRNIEDSNRRDKNEGYGKLVYNEDRPVITVDPKSMKVLSETSEYGPVYFNTTFGNPCYILCFHGPEVDIKHIIGQDKRYIVRINAPETLVSDIASFLEKCQNLPSVNWLECVQVRYDKGQFVTEIPEPASEERLRMSYCQKDSRFSDDCEFRLVLKLDIIGNNPPSQIEVNLHKKLEYVEWACLLVNQVD